MRNGMRFLAASPSCMSMSGGVQFRRVSSSQSEMRDIHTYTITKQKRKAIERVLLPTYKSHSNAMYCLAPASIQHLVSCPTHEVRMNGSTAIKGSIAPSK